MLAHRHRRSRRTPQQKLVNGLVCRITAAWKLALALVLLSLPSFEQGHGRGSVGVIWL
jgi:hypothetical protein